MCGKRTSDFSTAPLNNNVQSPANDRANSRNKHGAAEIKMSACHCECAVHKSAEKHACGEVFSCTHRSDREAPVHHRSMGILTGSLA